MKSLIEGIILDVWGCLITTFILGHLILIGMFGSVVIAEKIQWILVLELILVPILLVRLYRKLIRGIKATSKEL